MWRWSIVATCRYMLKWFANCGWKLNNLRDWTSEPTNIVRLWWKSPKMLLQCQTMWSNHWCVRLSCASKCWTVLEHCCLLLYHCVYYVCVKHTSTRVRLNDYHTFIYCFFIYLWLCVVRQDKSCQRLCVISYSCHFKCDTFYS